MFLYVVRGLFGRRLGILNGYGLILALEGDRCKKFLGKIIDWDGLAMRPSRE